MWPAFQTPAERGGCRGVEEWSWVTRGMGPVHAQHPTPYEPASVKMGCNAGRRNGPLVWQWASL
eukprot:scaffold14114_cov90-Isochrysis_galbana.AAC.3